MDTAKKIKANSNAIIGYRMSHSLIGSKYVNNVSMVFKYV